MVYGSRVGKRHLQYLNVSISFSTKSVHDLSEARRVRRLDRTQRPQKSAQSEQVALDEVSMRITIPFFRKFNVYLSSFLNIHGQVWIAKSSKTVSFSLVCNI